MTAGKLRILQIGAGSMGNRRLRDLSQREDVALAVFDSRTDRRTDAAAIYRIPAFATFEAALEWKPQAVSISTPPDAHESYVRLAVDRGLHHFCEANIWTLHGRQVEHVSRKRGSIGAPSCTFHFHPLVKILKQLVKEALGKLHTWQFCLSTYMPDWHPTEGNDYYARRRGTAAAREMVPFELLWLNDVFGCPASISGMVGQLASLGKELEDTWCLQIELAKGAIGQLSVLMGCPIPCRRGWCLGENGLIEFDLWNGALNLRLKGRNDLSQQFGAQAELIEDMYKREINTFVDAIRGTASWPLNYRDASIATAMLAAAELSSLSAMHEKADTDRQPASLPTGYTVRHRNLGLGSARGLGRPIGDRFNADPQPYETSGGKSE